MTSNIGTHEPDIRIQMIDAGVEFATFDRLPPNLRRLVNEAPIKIMAASVAQAIQDGGYRWAEEAIGILSQQVSPGFTPIVCRKKRRSPMIREIEAYRVPSRKARQ